MASFSSIQERTEFLAKKAREAFPEGFTGKCISEVVGEIRESSPAIEVCSICTDDVVEEKRSIYREMCFEESAR